MEKKKKYKNAFHEFLNSPENQKKYGFSVETVDGIQSIYYDGDPNVLLEAVYGRAEIVHDEDSTRIMKLSVENDHIYVHLPDSDEKFEVAIKVGEDVPKSPYIKLTTTDNNEVLCRLSMIDPMYYPDEESCRFILDISGLTALNHYMLNGHYSELIDEFNRIFPDDPLPLSQPIPNYRYLGSSAYKSRKD